MKVQVLMALMAAILFVFLSSRTTIGTSYVCVGNPHSCYWYSDSYNCTLVGCRWSGTYCTGPTQPCRVHDSDPYNVCLTAGCSWIPMVEKTCYFPPFDSCDAGYECVKSNFSSLYGLGKKIGWTCFTGVYGDSGAHNYKIRVVMDIVLLYWETVTSKTYFPGTYFLNISHANNIISMTSGLDFNYSYPGIGYVFDPSYIDQDDARYFRCAVFWLNYSQSDAVNISVPILYKTYITDLNRDGVVDMYDGIILTNNIGKKWGKYGDAINTSNTTWRADINTDESVNVLDVILLKNQFGSNYIKPLEEGNLLDIWTPMWNNTRECGVNF